MGIQKMVQVLVQLSIFDVWNQKIHRRFHMDITREYVKIFLIILIL